VTLTVYQPQIEEWDGNHFECRMAVEVQPAGDEAPVYGVIWMSAQADVDKAARIVTMQDIKVTKANFPTEPSKEGEYLEMVRRHINEGVKTIALDHLEASFAISESVKKAQAVTLKNDPPRIIFSTRPGLLILIDGNPVLRPVKGQNAERVINTRAFIVKLGDKFYLQAMDYWYEAPAVEGPWMVANNVPSPLEQIKQDALAAQQVDLIEPAKDAPRVAAPPAIYISTVPAELIQSDGKPEFLPIEGTELLQVKNSDNIIFMDVRTNDFYVLISGRWFRAKSLDGPWAFVPGKELPSDLAKIPPDHPRANALVSVPDTPQAQSAVIANSIPQTSTVYRSEAKLEVTYDGPPQFRPIQSTPLQYAVNTPLPVISVDANTYYCVQNGIWFVASSPTGPWVVATSVPAIIYTIPASSPVHYVTYVQVYGWTPEVVYVGYTPGYLGTVVSPEGVVVYGTGYYYPPYIGTYWIGWPWTYGFGVGFAWDFTTGFAFGFAAGAFWGTWCHPWWGPIGWGWYHGWNYNFISLNHVSIYNHWGDRVVVNHGYNQNEWRDNRWSQTGGRIFNPYSARQRVEERDWGANSQPRDFGRTQPEPSNKNNVFSGRDGQVYRQNESGGWETSTQKGWQNMEQDPGSQNQSRELNRERSSRETGNQRFNNSHSSGGFRRLK
jgi:hypothetical protein